MKPTDLALTLLAFACSAIYAIEGYRFACGIFPTRRSGAFGLAVTLPTGLALLAASLYLPLTATLHGILLYLCVLLCFLLLFHGSLAAFLFAASLFQFHIMNLRMGVFSVFALLRYIHEGEPLDNAGGARFGAETAFLTVLFSLIVLEIFRRTIDQHGIRLLLENSGQLRFVTMSSGLICIYLLVLSISFEGPSYSLMSALFFLCTSLLLFGAFYTSFRHAVKMSALIEDKVRSTHSISQLQTVAYVDELTQVYNRRYGVAQLEQLLGADRAFCLCFIDTDRLKAVNDDYGHEEGDRYLRLVARELSTVLPEDATLCRMGGDEFMILLPDCTRERALELLEQANQRVMSAALAYPASISYGVVDVAPGGDELPGELLRRADEQMYACKREHHRSAAGRAPENPPA